MAKREHEWFLEPRDSHTNEVISKNVGEENILQNVVCADGQKHNLWRCPSGMVTMLWRSRGNLKIRFQIFSRELPNGKIRNCTLIFKNESGGKTRKKRRRKNYAKS